MVGNACASADQNVPRTRDARLSSELGHAILGKELSEVAEFAVMGNQNHPQAVERCMSAPPTAPIQRGAHQQDVARSNTQNAY